ncbi:MAG: hypothetical protein ACE5FJ_03935 [Gemmatimonadales bacterium]
MTGLLIQTLSLVGASLILGAYLALQRGYCRSRTRIYLLANLLGAVLLTIVAAADRRIGFIVLEGSWSLISLWSLIALPSSSPTPN